ncbi:Phosphorylase b kinase gamma catalytic chain, liver/testis isoform [Tritrichomonas foetus]|uniref:Phosphorylase b kinase gamma catalytic chain, liver/testis isoform n=1 Tax=Tritrichomonas foetus TaxID=1144522 RepID=A0A1J4KXS6_9EUKA|nr:Phosphorylase b kinase gamma catalytic chain, liver/testis isoform [Tritrichomonas foetus]|eukprot:OHT16057.1 Phosphorylase b kinase gamma catalytic chain, liver/testis isoform [Tritrichomonas foetus]
MDLASIPTMIRDYQVLGKIGTGRYGTAFRVFSHRYKCDFCLKVISANDQTTPQLTRFLFNKEAETLRKVGHINVIRLYDYFQEGDYFYIVTELCGDGTLANYLDENEKMDITMLKVTFRHILEAISFIHSLNICHRDIKPANIGFDSLKRPKILDWGYSTVVQEGQKLTTYCGSYPYVAPECVSRTPYDGKMCDIWALGVTLYVMALGQDPWTGKHQNEKMTQIVTGSYCIPPGDTLLSDLIRKMLRVQPEQRITASEALKHEFFRVGCQLLKPKSVSARAKMILPKYSSIMLQTSPEKCGNGSESSRNCMSCSRRRINGCISKTFF